MVVHLLVLISNSHAAKIDFGPPSRQGYFRRIAGSTVMQGHSVQQYIAVGFLIHIQIAETHTAGMSFFKLI